MALKRLISVFIVLYAFIFSTASASADKYEGGMQAKGAWDFLNSIGVCVHVQHGQDAVKIAPLLKYTGIRNVRDAADRNYDMSGLLFLNREAGVKIVIGPGSGVTEGDLEATLSMARELHRHKALLAIEGPNEPNNFGGLSYGSIQGGGGLTWMPVALFQSNLYRKIKQDNDLKNYPVYSVTETGAQTDNCGLQFLQIPEGHNTLMPSGTVYADYANCHNYMYHPSWSGAPHDNQVWNAADPSENSHADGLYVNFGKTWLKGFEGYSDDELFKLPKVTTETGVRAGDLNGKITEHVQGCNYMNLFLAQFKRGWDKTFIYELIDDPDGAFGLYKSDYATPRKAAFFIHNLTHILHDSKNPEKLKHLDYKIIPPESDTVHDLLLQKSNSELWLVIWGESVSSVNDVIVYLPKTIDKAIVYDPVNGVAPYQEFKGIRRMGHINLNVSDHPILINFGK